MARDLRVFDVFVASPSDVAEERDRLEDVIKELNDIWQGRLGIQMNLLRWETHTHPGFGEDAQDVINQQMPDSIDVFIGILWARIGTPTQRSASGTLEEFERAHDQWKRNPNSIKLLIYFKKAPVEFDAIDPEQIKQLQEFQSRLPNEGSFYCTYRSSEEFEKVARKHLQLLAQELSSQKTEATPEASLPEGDFDRNDAEEAGLLDLVDEWTDGFDLVNSIVNRFGTSVRDLGTQMAQGNEDLLSIGAENPSRIRDSKRIINSMANRLVVFSEALDAELPVLDEAFERVMRALDKAIEIAPDFGADGVERMRANRPALVEFEQDVRDCLKSTQKMSENLQSLPRVTTQFNSSKRVAVRSLQSLCRSLQSMRAQIKASIDLLDTSSDGI